MLRMLLLAVSIASTFMLTGCAKSPESTVESFYKAVGNAELTQARTYFSSEVTGMIGPKKLEASLAHKSERVKKCGGIKSIDVKLEGQGEVRSGTALITFGGNCPPNTERVKLINEDGKWKLGLGR